MFFLTKLWTKILFFSAIAFLSLILISLLILIVLSIISRYEKNKILRMQKIQLIYAYGAEGKVKELNLSPSSDYQGHDDLVPSKYHFYPNKNQGNQKNNHVFPEIMESNPLPVNNNQNSN